MADTDSKITVHKAWNAVTKANTWSRICYVRSSNFTGSSAILNLKATRSSVVCNATLLINASHPSCCNLVQLNANSYSRLTIRSVVDSQGNYYLELYDAGENQIWNCTMIDIQSSNITVYTAFTDGSTIPSGFTIGTHFTVFTGRTMAADKFIGTFVGNLNGNASTATKLIDTVYSVCKTMAVDSAGKWYRLGHVERTAVFYGEFIVYHNWSQYTPEISKFIVGGGCNNIHPFNIHEIFNSYTNAQNNDTNRKIIKKARVVYWPAGTEAYNIYVDVFLQNSMYTSENTWSYSLVRNGILDDRGWIDDNFAAGVVIPSGYDAVEVSFA